MMLCCLLVFSGCSFKKDDAEAPKATEQAPDVVEQIKTERQKEAFNGQLNAENVQVSFKEAEMGFYEMTIAWPSEVAKVQVIANARKEIVTGAGSTAILVEQGSTQVIELTAFDSFGSPVSVYLIQKDAPVDVIIQNPRYLVEDTNLEANRLYLLAGSFIETNGHHLSISVKSLFVAEPADKDLKLYTATASIRNQSAQNYISEPFQSRNSSISITAHKAVGTLRVAMIGFNGRDGRSGQELEKLQGVSRQRDTKLDGANGTNEAARQGTRTPDGPGELICLRPASSGQDGKQGAPGTDGENGQDGGHTGNLIVTIDDFTQFSLEVGTMAGRAGKGAAGTPGHEGGRGGAAGAVKGVCAQIPRAGKNGIQGPHGANGKDGAPGKVGTISSNVSKQKIFDLSVGRL